MINLDEMKFFLLGCFILKKYKKVSFSSPAGKSFPVIFRLSIAPSMFSFEFSSSIDRFLNSGFLAKSKLPFQPTKIGVFVYGVFIYPKKVVIIYLSFFFEVIFSKIALESTLSKLIYI